MSDLSITMKIMLCLILANSVIIAVKRATFNIILAHYSPVTVICGLFVSGFDFLMVILRFDS